MTAFPRFSGSFINSYLSNRSQTVKLEENISEYGLVQSDVPQESVQGLFLFNIYISDSNTEVKLLKLRSCADDIQLTPS